MRRRMVAFSFRCFFSSALRLRFSLRAETRYSRLRCLRSHSLSLGALWEESPNGDLDWPSKGLRKASGACCDPKSDIFKPKQKCSSCNLGASVASCSLDRAAHASDDVVIIELERQAPLTATTNVPLQRVVTRLIEGPQRLQALRSGETVFAYFAA